MAKIRIEKPTIVLSVEEKKFLDNFFGEIYEQFEDGDEEQIGQIVADIYNLYLNESRPLPQTYKGVIVTVTVEEGE